MGLKLYMNDASPGVRAVLLTAKALDLNMEIQEINLFNKEHLTPEFLKMNPQHTVPTLVDDDFIICDSHAIVTYLTEKYGKNDDLYPKDLRKRALTDQRLHFDSGVLFPRIRNILYPIAFDNEKQITTAKIDAIREAYEFMEIFLSMGTTYIAGNSLTVADFCCVTTLSTLTLIIPISAEKFPNLTKWYHLMKTLPYYEEINVTGLNKVDVLVSNKLGDDYRTNFKSGS